MIYLKEQISNRFVEAYIKIVVNVSLVSSNNNN